MNAVLLIALGAVLVVVAVSMAYEYGKKVGVTEYQRRLWHDLQGRGKDGAA